jgi:hypothetical protein
LRHFFHELPSTELRKEGWNLTTCYIRIKTGSEVRQRLPLSKDGSGWPLFIWRTPHPDIVCEPHNVNQPNGYIAWGRDCLKVVDAKTPNADCVILIAVQPGSYWLHHRVGKNIDADAEAARFGAMDLSSLWVETARKTGPLCEKEVDFGNGSLLITPWVDISGVGALKHASLCLYLAVVDRKSSWGSGEGKREPSGTLIPRDVPHVPLGRERLMASPGGIAGWYHLLVHLQQQAKPPQSHVVSTDCMELVHMTEGSV